MKKGIKSLLTLALSGLLWNSAYAQGSEDYGTGLKLNLNPEGNKYIRFIVWNQIWARSIQNNPGTMVNDQPQNTTSDIGARRLRMLAFAQISPRYLVLTHIGINNQTFINGGASGATGTGAYGQGKKPGIFFHDVWNEYAIVPAKDPESGKVNKNTIYLGAGLHYWHGLSRITSGSTLNFLTIDAPIFNWPLIENSDQFARQFGFYTKGRLGKLAYQMHLNKPFATNSAPAANANVAVDNNNGKSAIGGYFDYQFLDQEANVLPFRVGSYLGTKKVFNLGLGFYRNAEGTKSKDATNVTRSHDITLLAVDAFADLPFGPKEKRQSITAYSVFYNYDFGPNYLRNIGIMNVGVNNPNFSGQRALEGAGNARAMIGTGSIWYTQAGYMMPSKKGAKARFQPFAAYARKNFEAHNEVGNFWDIGANLFLDGHHAKITGQYSIRPLYDTATKKVFDRKGELCLQLQVYL